MALDPSSIPKLPRGVRLRHDDARDRHVLLAPVRMFDLDAPAVAVIEAVDGRRSVAEIADLISARFAGDRAVIERDVVETLDDLARKRMLET